MSDRPPGRSAIRSSSPPTVSPDTSTVFPRSRRRSPTPPRRGVPRSSGRRIHAASRVARIDDRGVRRYPVYSSTSIHPKLFLYPTATPGDSIIPVRDIHILTIEGRTNTKVEAAPMPERALGWSDAGRMEWAPGSDRLFFVSAARANKVGSTLFRRRRHRQDPGNRPRFVRHVRRERERHLHRQLADPRSWRRGPLVVGAGRLGAPLSLRRRGPGHQPGHVGPVAGGPGAVRRFRPASRSTSRRPAAIRPQPYYTRLYPRERRRHRAGPSSPPNRATTRSIFAPGGRYFIDIHATPDSAPVTGCARRSTAGVLMTLEQGDVSQLRALGWTPAQVPSR